MPSKQDKIDRISKELEKMSQHPPSMFLHPPTESELLAIIRTPSTHSEYRIDEIYTNPVHSLSSADIWPMVGPPILENYSYPLQFHPLNLSPEFHLDLDDPDHIIFQNYSTLIEKILLLDEVVEEKLLFEFTTLLGSYECVQGYFKQSFFQALYDDLYVNHESGNVVGFRRDRQEIERLADHFLTPFLEHRWTHFFVELHITIPKLTLPTKEMILL